MSISRLQKKRPKVRYWMQILKMKTKKLHALMISRKNSNKSDIEILIDVYSSVYMYVQDLWFLKLYEIRRFLFYRCTFPSISVVNVFVINLFHLCSICDQINLKYKFMHIRAYLLYQFWNFYRKHFVPYVNKKTNSS